MHENKPKPLTDILTVIALSMLAYTLATLLHEHLGHALTCALLGGSIKELGAFYVDCNYASMSYLSIRLVALAGPLMSLVTGVFGLFFFERTSKTNSRLKYFLWLFGTVSLMTATGYLLFSGVSGIGDFGTGAAGTDGVFFGARPEWIYRVVLSVLGVASYFGVMLISLRKMDSMIGGQGTERVGRAQRLSLTSYLTGAVISILVGFLNPQGIVIVLISAAASSLGGTSALAWMMQLLDRKKVASDAPLAIKRSWSWIIAGLVVALLYTAIFGPTVRP